MFYLNGVGYKGNSSSSFCFLCIRFYLNGVGYKVLNLFLNDSKKFIGFYLNGVGYKG